MSSEVTTCDKARSGEFSLWYTHGISELYFWKLVWSAGITTGLGQ